MNEQLYALSENTFISFSLYNVSVDLKKEEDREYLALWHGAGVSGQQYLEICYHHLFLEGFLGATESG